jgi:hypothetical protein
MPRSRVRTVVSRLLWAGRLTSSLVGLALLLAFAVGLGTTALAAVPGAPLRLGQSNTINAVTSLAGRSGAALLRLDNDGAGPALALQVEPGNPPLTVNAGAGKATNLNADRLDGLDEKAFARRLWAKVRYDGFLLQGTGATAATRQAVGAGFQYFVTFDRSVASCGYVASVGEDFSAYNPPGEIQAALATLASGRTDTVFVSIDGGTTTVARQFSLMVLC